MTNNEFGIQVDQIKVKKVRFRRFEGKWLVEYQRVPRWIFGIDGFWWFNDGLYTEYHDAIARVHDIRTEGFVNRVQFHKPEVFEVEE